MIDKSKRWTKKRWAALLSPLFLVGIVIYFALPYALTPRGTSTIGLKYAGDTFHQCSRDTPQPDEASYWVPTRHEIAEADSLLWVMLQGREMRGLRLPAVVPFHRQYIGFKRGGVRLIYVNAFADLGYVESDDWNDWFNWAILGKPVSACDGGRYFWGAVYNPETREYEEPQFNGAI